MFDYLIIGAGFSGAVMAERIANVMGKKVLIVEKRNHIGGNAYDKHNEEGILVHQYGPHIFHTKLKNVWDYISQFTEWQHYHHRVLGSIDGKQVPIPFNLTALKKLFPEQLANEIEHKLVQEFGCNTKVPILKLREANDEQLRLLANYIYDKVFVNYTTKQWGMLPEELDPLVTGRVPVHISRDDRYFQDPYQGLPKHGYTSLFENMLRHPSINLMLNTDYHEVVQFDHQTNQIYLFNQPFKGKVIYTGKIDELFGYKFGELPYRSLRFEFDTLPIAQYQETGTVNYPNEYDFTRITEFKHMTGKYHRWTTIVREYPQVYNKDVKGQDIPYYPISKPENRELYKKYYVEAKAYNQLVLLGRLAEYTYYDMDACIAKALKVFEQQLLE
ncbi:UDP-galactopyranose mutase [Paenibacillus sp. PAMC21692]|uniref:UDP-galactopyranose mutase n=1 Tax=Paenibacillus sp. PAMC21692 TaxID=2762320 RepID=UPI00164D68C1|nr:UDP-galactopyranose mutase [Paenibacillus sp. PAMC21692]QNK58375.1 UDP-galactopyranose mutase [Paenibacillus sp. PAMC21692]